MRLAQLHAMRGPARAAAFAHAGQAPSLVADFEHGLYGTGALQASPGDLLLLARATAKTVAGPDAAPRIFDPDAPAFDWSTGRRGLHLSPAAGATAADVARLALGDWWIPAGGTIVVEAHLVATSGTYDRLIELNANGSSSERISVLYNSGLGRVVLGVYAGGQAQAVLNGPETAFSPGQPVRVAATFGPSRFALSVAGRPALSAGTGSIPAALDRLWLGCSSANSNQPTLVMHRIMVFPVTMGDGALASLSAAA